MTKTLSFRADEQTIRQLETIIQIEQTKVAPCVRISRSDMIESAISIMFEMLVDNGEVNDWQYNYVYQLENFNKSNK